MSQRRFNRYKSRLIALIKHPFFWVLTFFGNTIILLGSFLLYQFESAQQNVSVGFLDCVLWTAGIVTTIGYGSYAATTTAGKITVLVLMLAGTLFVWTYMAFLVTGLITPELSSIEKDIHDVEKEIQDLKRESNN